MAKKIKLNDIIGNGNIYDIHSMREGWTKRQVIKAMKDYGKQLLELAADNAKTKIHTIYPLTPMPNGTYPTSEVSVIDKQSITDTINQIK